MKKVFGFFAVAILSQLGAQDSIYLQPNTTQIFTELYQAYGMLDPLDRTFFENALYLDQVTQPSILPMQPSNQAILDYSSEVLAKFHRRVGDLELYIDPTKPKPFFYVGSGAKQLIVALVYAMVMSEPDKKFLFVEQAPFYSGHPNAVTGLFKYPNARFLAFHRSSEIDLKEGEVLVEFVTSPNNPDGKFRKPLTDAKVIIADLVFASSVFDGYIQQNIDWIRQARFDGKLVFSFNSASKQFGKTGCRCGYMWYPIYDSYAASIFKNFFNYISFSTVGAGSVGLSDFLNLIEAFLDLPDTGKALRKDGKISLARRHQLVEQEILKRYPGSTIMSIPGSPTFFAKIKDGRIPQKRASDVLFDDLNVVVNNGTPMGETDEFIRLNLCGYSEMLVDFLNRLARSKIYKTEDVLSISTKVSSVSVISARESNHTVYMASPGDSTIEADALKGPIQIIFPSFIDYTSSNAITVKKIDSSDHPVEIKSENFTEILEKKGHSLQVQWSQPGYLNGRWEVVKKNKVSPTIVNSKKRDRL